MVYLKNSRPTKKNNNKQFIKLFDTFRPLSREQKENYIRQLSKQERRRLYQFPDLFLFDKQIINDGDWIYYLLRCGRGFGKSHAGAAWVAKQIRNGAKKIGLCGPTYSDVADTMVPMILSWFTADEFLDPSHPYADYKIRFKNKAIIYCYSSEVEKKGPNLDYLWCDEIATWCQSQPDKTKERFDDISRAVRKAKHPRIIITSTPKNHPFFTWFQEQIDGYNPSFCMMQGSMFDNPTLSDLYKQNQVALYGHNSRGRQELYGDLITDTPGAYWTHQLLDDTREQLPAPSAPVRKKNVPLTNAQLMGAEPIPPEPPKDGIRLLRTVIGFDPAVSKGGDECGIIVVALYSNNHAYVLDDRSDQYSPAEYAKLIDKLYQEYGASAVVVEINNGGNTFEALLRSANSTMKIVPRRVHHGKETRAEHISNLYSLHKVHHTRVFKQLEDQMCQFNVNYSKSPDRLDALGLALTELFWPTAPGSLPTLQNIPSR